MDFRNVGFGSEKTEILGPISAEIFNGDMRGSCTEGSYKVKSN